MGRIPVRQIAPDKHHCGAGSWDQDDRHCDVLIGFGRRDPRGENDAEEQLREECRRKRFDHPIDEPRNDESGRGYPDVPNRGEIDLHHHRYDHRPDGTSIGRLIWLS
jgi:hypothetical protein